MSNELRNIIRTLVPSVVGAVLTEVARLKTHLTPAQVAVLFPALTTGYYAIVRWAEEKWPKASWLLGCLPVKAAVQAPPVK